MGRPRTRVPTVASSGRDQPSISTSWATGGQRAGEVPEAADRAEQRSNALLGCRSFRSGRSERRARNTRGQEAALCRAGTRSVRPAQLRRCGSARAPLHPSRTAAHPARRGKPRDRPAGQVDTDRYPV